MRRWVRRWQVTILYEHAHRSPYGTNRYKATVDTVAQLRTLIQQARSDPNAWHLRYRPVRELVGDSPDRCGRGHWLGGGSATRATVAHVDCPCGGHLLWRCRTCPDVVVDPPLDPDCEPVAR